MSYNKIELNILLSLNSSRLDESDFILLSVKFLEKSLNKSEDLPVFLQDIQSIYFKQDYKEAIEKIIDFAKKNDSLLSPNVVQRLIAISSNLKSSPKDNDSRRLYESLYADHLESVIKEANDFSMFNELIDSYNTVKPEYADSHSTEIQNIDQAKQFILSFLILNDNVELHLKAQSKRYKQKDRSREELGDTLSMNPGIMNPNAPNFPDNLVAVRKVPKIGIDERLADGYSKNNPTTPFVASLSGTTYSLVVVLKDYMDKHKMDTDLEKKVNTIINLWIASYIKGGYHSYKEVVDVLSEPFIQAIFDEANIKLNFGVLDETTDEFRKAQNYAFVLASKSMMHEELLDRFKNKEKNQKLVEHFGSLLKNLSQHEETKGLYGKKLDTFNNLVQDWSQQKKSYDSFRSEANQLLSDIESEAQINSRSIGVRLRNLGDFLLYLITFRFLREEPPKSSSSPMMIIAELRDTFEQIDLLQKTSLSTQKPASAQKSSKTLAPNAAEQVAQADLFKSKDKEDGEVLAPEHAEDEQITEAQGSQLR